jgi:hypothetical protein
MVGGRKFFDRTEVKILLNYMRVVSHTGHSDACRTAPLDDVLDEVPKWDFGLLRTTSQLFDCLIANQDGWRPEIL